MKLSQLYSSISTFKNIKFNNGLNIILGEVKDSSNKNKDSHNLGKSTLIELIDFMLLKKLDKNHFLKNNVFKDYIFYLELKLNSGQYITIRRAVKDNSKVQFIENEKSYTYNEYDFNKIKKLNLTQSKKELSQKLNFDILKDINYRKYITYFLRSQRDYTDVFRLAKNRGKDIDWKPTVFELLGYNKDILIQKYKLDDEANSEKTLIQQTKDKLDIDTSELPKLKSALQIKNADIDEAQEMIDKFSFVFEEAKLDKELVNNIESSISDLNNRRYDIELELNQLNESLDNNITLNIKTVKSIFEETKTYLPEKLLNDYNSLIRFNEQISLNREELLTERIKELATERIEIRSKLDDYNNRRSKILSVLNEEDTFKKFKYYQNEVSILRGDAERIKQKISDLEKIDKINDNFEVLKKQISVLNKEIKKEIDEKENPIFSTISQHCYNIFRNIFNSGALLYLEQNTNSNVDFNLEVSQSSAIEKTEQSKGYSYRKMLSATFDISLLISYSQNSFIRFCYHDGTLEGMDNRKKSNYLEEIINDTDEFGIQYIFTAIAHDIPNELKPKLKKYVCLELSDDNEKGTLFGMTF